MEYLGRVSPKKGLVINNEKADFIIIPAHNSEETIGNCIILCVRMNSSLN